MHPHPMTGVLIKGGKFGDQCTGEEAHEDRGRDCGGASISHGMLRNAKDCWQPPEARRGKKGSPHGVFRESMALLIP